MAIDPLQTACLHVATPQEQQRDPDYRTCNAQPGEPCTWAKRHDGITNPPFHAERFEGAAEAQARTAAEQGDLQTALEAETFHEALLDTGMV